MSPRWRSQQRDLTSLVAEKEVRYLSNKVFQINQNKKIRGITKILATPHQELFSEESSLLHLSTFTWELKDLHQNFF